MTGEQLFCLCTTQEVRPLGSRYAVIKLRAKMCCEYTLVYRM